MYPSFTTFIPAGIVASLPEAGKPLSQFPALFQSLLIAPVKVVCPTTLTLNKQAKAVNRSLMVGDFRLTIYIKLVSDEISA